MSVCLFRRSTHKYLSDAAVQSDGDELGGEQGIAPAKLSGCCEGAYLLIEVVINLMTRTWSVCWGVESVLVTVPSSLVGWFNGLVLVFRTRHRLRG